MFYSTFKGGPSMRLITNKKLEEARQKLNKQLQDAEPVECIPKHALNNENESLRRDFANTSAHIASLAGCKDKKNLSNWYDEVLKIKAEYGLNFTESLDSLNDEDYIKYLNRKANLSRSYGARKLCHPNQKGVVCYCT